MSAPNANNIAPSAPPANPSASSSVPMWGEPGFVAVDGARLDENGFVPCGRPGHAGPRANLQHTADECRFGGPSRPSATNRVRNRQPARGNSRQNNFAGSGQHNIFPGTGHHRNFPGYGPQVNFPGYGQQNSFSGFGQQNTHPGFGHQQGPTFAVNGAGLPQGPAYAALTSIANNIADMVRAEQDLQQQIQHLLAQQQRQQKPPLGPPHRQSSSTAAQRNGVKKNQKQGARKHWQPHHRRDNNNGSGGNVSAGAGGSASI
jgi:hypothetical protein